MVKGMVFVLTDLTIFSPHNEKITLNITENNIKNVFYPSFS